MGIYIYSDGVVYEGQFEEDKKTGFGIYKWLDGRQYEGYWHKGKQHGLGILFDDKKLFKQRHGLWEQGKRITLFTKESEINSI